MAKEGCALGVTGVDLTAMDEQIQQLETELRKMEESAVGVTGVDLTAMDQQIQQLETELRKMQATREALGKLQSTLGNDADPTAAVRGTVLDRVWAFLADGKGATTMEIAAAIGAKRAAVYQVMRKHEQEFRRRDGRWRLKWRLKRPRRRGAVER